MKRKWKWNAGLYVRFVMWNPLLMWILLLVSMIVVLTVAIDGPLGLVKGSLAPIWMLLPVVLILTMRASSKEYRRAYAARERHALRNEKRGRRVPFKEERWRSRYTWYAPCPRTGMSLALRDYAKTHHPSGRPKRQYAMFDW